MGGADAWQCLGSESEQLLDGATRDNSTWQITDYLSIEPKVGISKPETRRMDMGLPGKLLELVQGRALRLQLPRQLTISNAIDDFGSELGLDQGTYASVDDKVDKLIGGFGSFEVHATSYDKDKDKQKKKKKSKKKKKKRSLRRRSLKNRKNQRKKRRKTSIKRKIKNAPKKQVAKRRTKTRTWR